MRKGQVLMKKKILVVGSLNMDMRIRVKEIPKVGETLLGDNPTYALGGKGSNQAGAAGKLGGNVAMLGYVGDDEFGQEQRRKLHENQVDVSAIGISKEDPTGTAVIYVNDAGNNSIVVIPGANNDCTKEYIEACDVQLEECDYVLIQMEIPVEAITYTVKKAKELGKTVILNPAPAPDFISDDILQNIDYITPNEIEVGTLTGCDISTVEGIKQGAKKLLNRGVRNVLVTMGEKGCLLINKSQSKHYPARIVKAVDTTAAGDCFNGAFVVALSEGKSEKEAVFFANASSSIAVTRSGALQSVPTRLETEEVLRNWNPEKEEEQDVEKRVC